MSIVSTIDTIFNMYKVPFETMDNLCVLDDNDTTIWYINLENIFLLIHGSYVYNQMVSSITRPFDTELLIMSNIINILQHYRLYSKKNKKNCKCILYWGYPQNDLNNDNYINSKYIPEYRKTYNNKLFINQNISIITKFIKNIYEKLLIIVDYMNEIYILDSNIIEPSIIPLMLDKKAFKDNKHQSIIVTNSKYEYQYVMYDFNVLHVKGKESRLVNSENIIDSLKQKRGLSNNTDTFPINYLPYTLSFIGDVNRNIPKIPKMGLSHIIKHINKCIETLILTENTKNLQLLLESVDINYKETFSNNYKAINLEYQLNDIPENIEFKLVSRLVDKFDDYALSQLNEKVFKRFPLLIIDDISTQVFNKIINNYTN